MSEDIHRLHEREIVKAVIQDAPQSSETIDVCAFGLEDWSGVRVFLYHDVLDELLFAAHYRSEPCVAGLLGSFSRDHLGMFVEVTGFDALEYVFVWSDLYKVTKGVLSDSIRSLSDGDVHAAKHLVGFFIHAPNSQGHLTEEMVRVHLSLLNMPSQLILVIDSVSNKLGIYARHPHGKYYNMPYAVVRARKSTSEHDEVIGAQEMAE